MARSEKFSKTWEPFREVDALDLNQDTVRGVSRSCNPTEASFDYIGSVELTYGSTEFSQHIQSIRREGATPHNTHERLTGIEHSWTSRNNRKGRHALTIEEGYADQYRTPPTSNSLRGILQGVFRMSTHFSFNNTSYLGGIVFTIGCTVLIANAILSFLPYHGWKPPDGITYVEAALTLVSTGLFLIGSTLTYLEAVNVNRGGCFGWKLERITHSETDKSIVEKGAGTNIAPDDAHCEHHHSQQTNLVGRPRGSARDQSKLESIEAPNGSSADKPSWRFFPTPYDFRTHFLYEIGFVANAVFLSSSLVFNISSVGGLISVLSNGKVALWTRYPQFIAGVGFTAASGLLMVETQKKWWYPAFGTLGWWINFFNCIGSVGFVFCAGFGLKENLYWAQYQFGCSYLWASLAFMFGSIGQWYEALDKYPVQRVKEKTKKADQ
ncbi:hypothetical protein LTR37_015259 [Vermiconidia calcicola]|uniref:Uncharacterized protein n=1 Tax=Vermiconidia calcicola TaxID=1690605 RepID=A0ACC3MRA5_9PEZI|nr:hypothetical protein LTR37_015259 [Vermiconidia calcicola]